MNRVAACLLALLLAGLAAAQPTKEEPVGLIMLPGGGKLLRANTETAVAARSGEILFSGDTIRGEGAPTAFLYCPGKSSQSVAAGGEVLLEAKQLKVKAGKLADQKPVAACFLPQTVRVAVASQQHYGVSMTRGTPEPVPPVPPDKLPPEVVSELAPLDKALAADPRDLSAMVARGAVFEKHKLLANALAEYRRVGSEWKDAIWIKRQIFDLEEALAAEKAAAAAQAPAGGQTFALVVGISKYQKLPQDLWLQYARADAEEFAKHLTTPRGGGLPAQNLLLMIDEKATTAALRSGFQTFLKARAGKKDTVFVLIAGHGTVETAGGRGAYILTNDSDPQDLGSTALPMAEIQNLLQEQLSKVGRVAVFVDVCHSGTIGSIRSTAINGAVERLGEAEGEIFGFMASRPKELSFEGPQYGGGHGAFTYFLLKGLEGEADKNKDNIVNVNELIEYVRTKVAEGTTDKQHPRDFGTLDNAVPLSDLSKPGIQIAGHPVFLDTGGEPLRLASTAPLLPQPGPSPALQQFAEALGQGKILPDEPGSAFLPLQKLKQELPPEAYLQQANQLRIALEDRSQQVLLRYLAGDQTPQNRGDFAEASRFIQAATLLTPESLYLEGRAHFFRGRTLLFDKQYASAADLLERSVAIDPGGAYAYNALGIAFLEQADFERAAAAFRDAIRRAPYWAYPVHNLALTYGEMGNYDQAVRRYQDAMRLAPGASYLPYNLGLVYQKLNRRAEAESAYRKAIRLAPQSAEPYNALGSLKASMGKNAEAEALYREALKRNPKLLPARHNLALLLSKRKDRMGEALDLWRQNLAQAPDYVASRLALAETLAVSGDKTNAIEQYRAVLKLRPEYVAARIALAGLLEAAGNRVGAIGELRRALGNESDNPLILERLGDLENGAGRDDEAARLYAAALAQATDGGMRKRLQAKLKSKPR